VGERLWLVDLEATAASLECRDRDRHRHRHSLALLLTLTSPNPNSNPKPNPNLYPSRTPSLRACECTRDLPISLSPPFSGLVVTMQSSEKAEFKNYLEQAGVIDALTKGTLDTTRSYRNHLIDISATLEPH